MEDEIHFVIKCDKHSTEREELSILSQKKVEKFNILSDKQKLVWILNCKDRDL